MKAIRTTSAIALAGIALGSCALGPDYERPKIAIPAGFKESADWSPARPRDDEARPAWWSMFHSAELDRLQKDAVAANQDLRIAEAHYRQSIAQVDASRAAFFPVISASASSTRSSNGAATVDAASLGATWVPDLWGSVRRGLEQSKANAQAGEAGLGAAVLSLQSTLALDYFSLRVADEQRTLLEEASEAYLHSLELTRSRYRGGVAAKTDVTQAEAQYEAVRAQAIDVGIQRGQLEHAIAVLLGKAPSEFSIARQRFDLATPEVPAALPSRLLERRPDVAIAERQAAAANAQIGISQAAFFPTLTLSATGGYRAPSGADLISAPYRSWSVGPAFALAIFDAGARSAARREAVAAWDAAAASYRKAVLAALQNVEDDLLALHLLSQEREREDAAVEAAQESLRLVTNQYKAGTVSYLNVITAQTTALNDRITALNIRGRQIAATVQLVTALGGDWPGLGAP